MDIKFETIKNLMKKKKYIATDEIVWDVIKGIKKMKNGNQLGQDLYSICLEGPPGAGKSFYAKTYKKVIDDVFDEDVEFLEYQCDSSTGKTDLFEEIRVAAAITGNKDEVIISGMLVEAIDAVNSGKKVILLLDEFEKSRKETDAFMYQFLQDGKIKTTQRGVVEIKPEYKKNLQVILCKNDERELADPLLRRNYIIRLDVMTPKNFVETVNMNLPQCDEDIRNIVSLLYDKMYKERENFAKFPSCSEGMLAIQDACDLLEEDAPIEVIYADILSNLLKHPDDIESFKMMLEKDNQLSGFVKTLKQTKKQHDVSAKDEIYRSFFSKGIQKISGMKDYYDKKIKSLNQQVSELKKKQANSSQNIKVDNNANDSNEEITIAQEIFEKIKFMSGEESALEGLPVDVPIDIINNPSSIFDGSENWYEIMEIEVEEEGWESLEKIAQGGIEEYTKLYCAQNRITIEGLKRNKKLQSEYKYQYELLCDKENVDKKWFKDIICWDGIILENPENETSAKIVAQKQQTEDGKNYYKIFSNKMIQNRDIYTNNIYTPLGGRRIGIGINGLRQILVSNNKPVTVRKNYLLYSTAINVNINYMKNNSYYLDYYGGEEGIIEKKLGKKREVFPGLYVIKETESSNSLKDYMWYDDLIAYSSKYLCSKDERPYKEFYEKLLSQERNNENITDKDDTRKEEIKTEIAYNDIGYEENVFLDGESVDVPIEIINRDGSIFDGSDKWYEIMELEVDEEKYKAIQELVEGGIDKFLEKLLKIYNVSKEELENNPKLNYYLAGLLKNQKKLEDSFFKKIICYDGIILNDDQKNDIKIVAQMQTREGKNYYKIFSKHIVQTDDELSHNLEDGMLNLSSEDNNIGINGLFSILRMQNVKYDYSSNFLIFSPGTMKYIEAIRKGDVPGKTESDINLKEVLPGVYLIRGEIKDKTIKEPEKLIQRSNLGLECLSKFVKMYENLLISHRLIETNTETDKVKSHEDGDGDER